MPEMIPVDSSNLKAIGYDEDTQEVFVEFLNNSTYKYLDVPQEIFEEFKAADSAGRFLHRRIKLGGFDYERVA
jgi:hypothetical protein